MDVTVGLLIYKSTEWLDFVLEGLAQTKNNTPYKIMVVANDPTPTIEKDPRVTHVWRNEDTSEWCIRRVYKAWNAVVNLADTPLIALLNSDMYVSDYWLDNLVKHYVSGKTVLTSLIVESGRIPSKFASHVKNLGTEPSTFDREAWRLLADFKRQLYPNKLTNGGLYMPVLLGKKDALAAGGYPEDECPSDSVSGDVRFFSSLLGVGCVHHTVMDSVVYHVQKGEMQDD